MGRKTNEQLVRVRFESGSEDCYLADDKGLRVGDIVEVPVGDYYIRTLATVVKIERFVEDKAPYPEDSIKHVIRKFEPELPHALAGSTFDIVSRVVDAFDPEQLLALGAPPGEYDVESQVIADRLEREMTPQQIAKVMNETFSHNFSEKYDENYFLAAATMIKEALEHQEEE